MRASLPGMSATSAVSPSRMHHAAQLLLHRASCCHEPEAAQTRQLPVCRKQATYGCKCSQLWVASRIARAMRAHEAAAVSSSRAAATCNDGPGHAIEFGGAAEQLRYSDAHLAKCRREKDELRARTRRKHSQAEQQWRGRSASSLSGDPALRLELVAKGRRAVGRAELCLRSA